MDYQRKTIPFFHKGMNWNAPPDKIPEGQIAYAKNARVEQQGLISTAHGHTQVFVTPGSYDYLHSISRLNITNPNFDPAVRRNYIVGATNNAAGAPHGPGDLLFFQQQANLNDSRLNPVTTPEGQFNEFSGNPLSIIDAQPIGAAAAWKYVGDSKQMVTVGYYPEDTATNPVRALTVGLLPPVNKSIPVPAGAGNLNGDYQWAFVYRRVPTGARSNPSAATRFQINHVALTLSNAQASMDVPFPPIDPLTGNYDSHVVVDIYRFGGTIFRWALVGSSPGGTTFVDNMPDLELLAAPAPSQATDATTGLSRFNLYMPFVTQDIHHSGQGILDTPFGNGIWQLTNVSGPGFNVKWLQGSTIYINDVAFTIYQVRDNGALELGQDAGEHFTVGQTVNWSTEAGTLMMGQPLPHLWGPYGIGQGGSYIFACGDPNAPGTLYWTNGNDPDSSDVVNNIVVTSPSEKLQTGCLYDGQPYCWSTERQFQIFPSLTLFGQFTVQELAGAKGVWLEWSLSVQTNGFADQSVTWRGKDGIYDWGSGTGLRRLSDDLYPFFPHDGEIGFAPETLMPFIGKLSDHPEVVGNIDDTQPQFHRTCWFHGMMFYDFVGHAQDAQGKTFNVFSTLVWDDVQVKGWVSLDQPFPHTGFPIGRGIEIGANDILAGDATTPDESEGPAGRGGNLKVAWGGTLYDYYGYTRGFEVRVVTRAEDFGDPRANKLFGDYWFDATSLAQINIIPLVSFHAVGLTPDAIAFSSARIETVLDFQDTVSPANNGIGLINQTLGLDIRWIAPNGQFAASINQWSPSYVFKPEDISFRFSDKSDDGVIQAKYLRGINLEADTFNQQFIMNVLVDGNLAGQLLVNHNGQSEKPYGFEPVAGYEFQVQMNFPQGVLWRLYKVRWIYDVWPDAVARKGPFMNYGEGGAKFIQGVVMPVETNGQDATITLFSDDDNTTRTWIKRTQPLVKTGTVFDLSTPFIAHQLQWATLTPHRIWPDEAKVIWEPAPELTQTWQTQEGDWDFCGWWHVRDCYIAYAGGTGTPVLHIKTEYGTMTYNLDPVTNGQYVRAYRVLAPQKSKWKSFRVDNPGGLRLFQKDCCVFAKEWGSTGAYVALHPFGDQSRVSGARI